MFKLTKVAGKLAAAVTAGSLPLVQAAHAAVPAGAQAVFTTMADDFETIAGYGFTAMAIIVGGMIVFKLVKRVANKAS